LDGLDPAGLLRQAAADATATGTTEASAQAFIPPSPEALAALFPQFDILALLGKGGMGAVYKVRQKALDRIAALKILPREIGDNPALATQFTREARALAQLNHPGIVTLYEFGETSGLFFFLMEFVDGMTLHRLLDNGRIAPRDALAIVPQICDALQYAHDHGVVHRDIKPENILLDKQGRVKIADFGLVKLVRSLAAPESSPAAASSTATLILQDGHILGTPAYMAPEQREHPATVDHRTDIYALGVVFYQMLTGELPGRPLQVPSGKVAIDVRLDEVVLRALESQPDRRYQHASDVKTRIEEITGSAAGSEKSTKPKRKSFFEEWYHLGAWKLLTYGALPVALISVPIILWQTSRIMNLSTAIINRADVASPEASTPPAESELYKAALANAEENLRKVKNRHAAGHAPQSAVYEAEDFLAFLKARNSGSLEEAKVKLAANERDIAIAKKQVAGGLISASSLHELETRRSVILWDIERLQKTTTGTPATAAPAEQTLQPDSGDNEALAKATTDWLAFVDAGESLESHVRASAHFRQKVPAAEWQAMLASSRKLLGETLSRKLKSRVTVKRLPNLPDGEYNIAIFESSFSNTKNAVETVTFSRESDGVWRAVGYYVR
jgi:serine/threonine protein kinase